ncbi:MAG: hypothetical protein ACI4R8_02880 [Candidatus Caccovivens sp.]
MFISISDNLKKLSKFFPENLYVVGGYVRNKLLGIESGDVDLSSSVNIEEVSKRLEGSEFSVKIKSLKCGSLLICKDDESYEYTAFRKDVYETDGSHMPIRVERTDKIEEDAQRRDFSVNAMYYNINKDEIVDLHHGIIDLTDKILKAINEDVLKFDGERVLRMVRIAGELNFKIDKSTLHSAQKYASNVEALSGERKYNELEKILYCDKRYQLNKKTGFKIALKLLNVLNIWKYFGLQTNMIKYKMVFKSEDRFLGLLIDIVDTLKPECLQVFLEKLLKDQFGYTNAMTSKVFVVLAGYYNALNGMKNKEYFFNYFENWQNIEPLIACKSKHLQNKYNFFYQYIIEHNLVIKIGDLAVDENDIKTNFPKIDKRNYDRILQNLLSKVFNAKVANEKESLIAEIEKNLQNY